MVATIIAVFGTVGLVATVAQSRSALAQSREVTKAELRPYLFVEKIDVTVRVAGSYQLVIWLKNFGRTPARNIRARIKTYVSQSVDDLRDFAPEDHLELSAAAPDHQRRAYWGLEFTEAEWATPSWACFAILRIAYSYTDDSGNRFEEAGDYYASQDDLLEPSEPVFFLLTDWTRSRHARRRLEEPSLFAPETIERLREQNLARKREQREQEMAEIREQMRRLDAPAKPKRKAGVAKPRSKPASKKTKTPGK
jgi:hypothetical protein